jgi:hypothetical protein
MNKQFIKSVAVGIMGLSLVASCSMMNKGHHKCNSAKTEKQEKHKCSAAKKDAKKNVKKQ